MNPRWCLLILLALAILSALVVCAPLAKDSAAQAPANSTPLLPNDGLHLYTHEAFEAFDPQTTSAVAGRYAELVDAGMDTTRYLFDWRDLEPAPGVYDIDLVIDSMDYRATQGIRRHFVNLVVLDSGGPVVPPYIEDLVNTGVAWDDPRISNPFASLLDAVVPAMLERGMFVLALSNEPGGYYEDYPGPAASFDAFLRAAIDHAHAIEPALDCTVVFAGPTDPAIPDLMSLVDVAAFNTYFYFPRTDSTCTIEGFPLPLYAADPASRNDAFGSAAASKLDALIAAADGKPIHIQEIGQSTGWDDAPRTLGPFASLRNQRAIHLALYKALDARRAHFRTVCQWTLNDHTEEGMRYLTDPLLAAGLPACYVENIGEIFGPTGLVRSDPTASKKPAFDDFKAAVRYFAAPRSVR